MKYNKKSLLKRIMPACLAVLLVFGLAACSNQLAEETQSGTQNTDNSQQNTAAESADPEESNTDAGAANTAGDSNILIAYFTVPLEDGVDTVARASRKEYSDGSLGNVNFMARVIQDQVGGDLFQIESVDGYPLDDMDDLLSAGYDEKSEDARPPLTAQIDNLEDYDIIFVGYPNWNADLPMPMYTFFEEHDLSGKTIIPFMAHGGSRASGTVGTIEELEPDATVIGDPVTVYWDELDDAETIVTEWVQGLDVLN